MFIIRSYKQHFLHDIISPMHDIGAAGTHDSNVVKGKQHIRVITEFTAEPTALTQLYTHNTQLSILQCNTVWFRDGRFGSKVGQIGPNGTNPGLFKSDLKYRSRQAKTY